MQPGQDALYARLALKDTKRNLPLLFKYTVSFWFYCLSHKNLIALGSPAFCVPDPRVIQQSVNAAQHDTSAFDYLHYLHLILITPWVVVDPPPVVAMRGLSAVGPREGNSTTSISGISETRLKSLIHSVIVDHDQVQSHSRPAGPDIFIPSALQKSSILPQARHVEQVIHPAPHFPGPSSAILHAPASGYSHQHALYASEQDRWMNHAYLPPPVNTILVEILASHDGSTRGHQRATQFGVSYSTMILLQNYLIGQYRVFVKARKMSMQRPLLWN